MIYFVEIDAAHFDPERTVGQQISSEGEDSTLLSEHLQLGNQILLLMVVQQQVLAFGYN